MLVEINITSLTGFLSQITKPFVPVGSGAKFGAISATAAATAASYTDLEPPPHLHGKASGGSPVHLPLFAPARRYREPAAAPRGHAASPRAPHLLGPGERAQARPPGPHHREQQQQRAEPDAPSAADASRGFLTERDEAQPPQSEPDELLRAQARGVSVL